MTFSKPSLLNGRLGDSLAVNQADRQSDGRQRDSQKSSKTKRHLDRLQLVKTQTKKKDELSLISPRMYTYSSKMVWEASSALRCDQRGLNQALLNQSINRKSISQTKVPNMSCYSLSNVRICCFLCFMWFIQMTHSSAWPLGSLDFSQSSIFQEGRSFTEKTMVKLIRQHDH